MFKQVEAFAGDPILSLNETFAADPRTDKVNLSIGIYFDEQGRLPLLESVQRAQEQIVAERAPKPYLPMEGASNFREAVQDLLFGANHTERQSGRLATIQTVGSSSALRIGAEFVKCYFPESGIWVSRPTWDNHVAVFGAAGLTVGTYPYFDDTTGTVDFSAMKATLGSLPPHSAVLLHACCHNPTGADLTDPQWVEVAQLLKERQLIAFLDMAYQGYGRGLNEDAFAPRLFASNGLSFLLVNSFSKNMGLYGERSGALTIAAPDAKQAACVLGQLKSLARKTYSSPPIFGGQITARLITDPVLFSLWEQEVAEMRKRILQMRHRLYDRLTLAIPDQDFKYLLRQVGMFSYTGLSIEQVDTLREQHGVYLLRSGRICIAGLNPSNLARTARALVSVMAAA